MMSPKIGQSSPRNACKVSSKDNTGLGMKLPQQQVQTPVELQMYYGYTVPIFIEG